MSLIAALFSESPAVAWGAVAALLLGAELASGRGRFVRPALAALVPALVSALPVPRSLAAQIAAYLAAWLLAEGFAARPARASRPIAARHGLPTPKAVVEPPRRRERFPRERPRSAAPKPRRAAATAGRSAPPQGKAARAPSVVGARGRTLGEFCNGVGRVWIDRAEWAAELISGEALAPDRDIEVVGVAGGVRLRIRPVG